MLKKLFVFYIGLIIIDQTIKLLISTYFMHVNAALLPEILSFRPIQNTHLNWIASILEYKTPLLLMIVIQILILTTIILLFRYFSYLWIQGKKYLYGMLIFYVSGITCSFIDVMFWGGSIDFLRLFDWFTFDLKAKRKQTGILIWIKKGMPNMPTE